MKYKEYQKKKNICVRILPEKVDQIQNKNVIIYWKC